MTDRSDYPTRKLALGDPEPDDTAALSPAERLALVWPLTLQAWAFKGLDHEPRLRRDVVRVVRRDLITTKRAAGRPRDLADIAELEGEVQ